MASRAPVKQMETLLECSICTETLIEPRSLPCFHSFCKHCLGNYIATLRKKAAKAGTKVLEDFECPLCMSKFHLKQRESVEQIPANYFINNMLELLNLQQQEGQRTECQSCKAKAPSTCKCITCERYLCEKCLDVHNNWPVFEDHVVLTLEELAKPENRMKARGRQRCKKHEKVLKFYCETCKVLACRYCVDVNHPRPEHLWFPLVDVVETHKEALKTSFAVFEQYLNKGIQSHQKIEHVLATLKDNTAKAKDAIIQQGQEILVAINAQIVEKTEFLLQEVDKKYNEAYKPLVKQQADIKAYVEKVKRIHEFSKSIISDGSDEDILSFKQEVEEIAGNIEKDRPDIMEPIHNGAIRYQSKPSKDILKNIKLNDIGVIELDCALQRKHEIDGFKLEISNQPIIIKPVKRMRASFPGSQSNERPKVERKEKIQTNYGRAYLGEVRTVIVNGLNPDTTNETLSMFFESSRRSGGGEIEKLERCERDVTHITFLRSEVALRVLKNDKLELDGYLLQLTEKQPELILPLDRKKLYVENIDVKTTKDSVWNYIEVITRTDVCKVEFGDNRNALITLNEEPGNYVLRPC